MTPIDRVRLAQAYLDGGDPLQALDMLAPLHEELDGHAAGQLLLARANYHSAQLGRAQATLEHLIESEPTDHYARFMLGRTLERQNKPLAALTHYQIAVTMTGRTEYRERLEEVQARLARAKPQAG